MGRPKTKFGLNGSRAKLKRNIASFYELGQEIMTDFEDNIDKMAKGSPDWRAYEAFLSSLASAKRSSTLLDGQIEKQKQIEKIQLDLTDAT